EADQAGVVGGAVPRPPHPMARARIRNSRHCVDTDMGTSLGAARPAGGTFGKISGAGWNLTRSYVQTAGAEAD
ncbi:MAG: hypothetical protein ACXWWK_09110, partial [Gemmatimonadales bacterium]